MKKEICSIKGPTVFIQGLTCSLIMPDSPIGGTKYWWTWHYCLGQGSAIFWRHYICFCVHVYVLKEREKTSFSGLRIPTDLS